MEPTEIALINICYMDTHRMPVRLERDGLKDAIVRIRFKTFYNEGYLVEKLIKNNALINSDEPLIQIPAPTEKNNIPIFLIGNSIYRIQITSDTISFNFVRAYPLWINYWSFIKSCLNILGDDIESTFISLQYISCFENESIFDNIDGDISLKYLPRFAGSEFSFSCHVHEKEFDATALIRITDNIKTDPNTTTSVMNISLQGSVNKTKSTFDDYVSFLHKHEKNLFFLLIKEDYIKSLGPHYE